LPQRKGEEAERKRSNAGNDYGSAQNSSTINTIIENRQRGGTLKRPEYKRSQQNAMPAPGKKDCKLGGKTAVTLAGGVGVNTK